ncbi:MAG TPA: hypothetical protein VFX28_12960 [Methylomirabilota bacterium]|nr:hypothetical protein [Methylomirabilota bacterium]
MDLETGDRVLGPGQAGEVPKAFVVRADPALTAGALLDWARGRLAGYKTLHEVEFVDAIPKAASGKILRRVLQGAGAHAAGSGPTPRTPIRAREFDAVPAR